jgi:hypothetical protein
LISILQFEKKALADALSLYMRGIMLLNDQSRSKIADPESIDDNFEHLKISCRVKGNQPQHYPFGEELFQKMKSVGFNSQTTNDKITANCIFDQKHRIYE